jgi:hypothetical protein
MVSKRSWAKYPATYRGRQIQILADWIKAGESGSVIGLPGAGKSNLLGFLSHRPDALQQYLSNEFGEVAFILVDLNNLPNHELATFFRVILRALYEAEQSLLALDETLPASIERLYRKVEDKSDSFLSQSALREAIVLFQQRDMRLVLVLDPFDQFCQTASTQVLDNLRGLRDSFKATLSYVMGLRHEVTYIRDPEELGELYEIVDTHYCWLGAMDEADAQWVVGQVEAALDKEFAKAQTARLIEVTGGYPALLRAASLWLADCWPVPQLDEWPSLLLNEPSIQNRLQDLRSGLTGEEEAVLSVLQEAWLIASPRIRQESLKQIDEKYLQVLRRLEQKRLCLKTEAGWQIFSSLFASFVTDMEGISAGKIWRDSATERFFVGDRELSGLSERDRRLLYHFIDHPRSAHTIDDLIEAAWPEDHSGGVSNEAVQQAIRHLRKQIEPNPAKPSYLVTERGAGYRFFAEGAPRG